MSALFPDVPIFSGVPAVLRQVGTNLINDVITALTGDSLFGSEFDEIEWGVFDQDGNQVLDPDSVINLEYMNEFRIPDYPIEQGGFANYNKVARPYNIRLEVAKSGSIADRQQFLDDIDTLINSTDLYTVIMPEWTFENANVVRRDFRRTQESGAQMIIVGLELQEVREQASTSFSNSKEASGADTTNNGSVQAQAPTSKQLPPRAPD
jgi:hypothetical protein